MSELIEPPKLETPTVPILEVGTQWTRAELQPDVLLRSCRTCSNTPTDLASLGKTQLHIGANSNQSFFLDLVLDRKLFRKKENGVCLDKLESVRSDSSLSLPHEDIMWSKWTSENSKLRFSMASVEKSKPFWKVILGRGRADTVLFRTQTPVTLRDAPIDDHVQEGFGWRKALVSPQPKRLLS